MSEDDNFRYTKVLFLLWFVGLFFVFPFFSSILLICFYAMTFKATVRINKSELKLFFFLKDCERTITIRAKAYGRKSHPRNFKVSTQLQRLPGRETVPRLLVALCVGLSSSLIPSSGNFGLFF